MASEEERIESRIRQNEPFIVKHLIPGEISHHFPDFNRDSGKKLHDATDRDGAEMFLNWLLNPNTKVENKYSQFITSLEKCNFAWVCKLKCEPNKWRDRPVLEEVLNSHFSGLTEKINPADITLPLWEKKCFSTHIREKLEKLSDTGKTPQEVMKILLPWLTKFSNDWFEWLCYALYTNKYEHIAENLVPGLGEKLKGLDKKDLEKKIFDAVQIFEKGLENAKKKMPQQSTPPTQSEPESGLKSRDHSPPGGFLKSTAIGRTPMALSSTPGCSLHTPDGGPMSSDSMLSSMQPLTEDPRGTFRGETLFTTSGTGSSQGDKARNLPQNLDATNVNTGATKEEMIAAGTDSGPTDSGDFSQSLDSDGSSFMLSGENRIGTDSSSANLTQETDDVEPSSSASVTTNPIQNTKNSSTDKPTCSASTNRSEETGSDPTTSTNENVINTSELLQTSTQQIEAMEIQPDNDNYQHASSSSNTTNQVKIDISESNTPTSDSIGNKSADNSNVDSDRPSSSAVDNTSYPNVGNDNMILVTTEDSKMDLVAHIMEEHINTHQHHRIALIIHTDAEIQTYKTFLSTKLPPRVRVGYFPISAAIPLKKYTEKHDIYVIMSYVFTSAKRDGYTVFNDLKMLMFNECGACVQEHVYKYVMEGFDEKPNQPIHIPQIVGVMSTITVRNLRLRQLKERLLGLYVIFKSDRKKEEVNWNKRISPIFKGYSDMVVKVLKSSWNSIQEMDHEEFTTEINNLKKE